MYQWFLTLPKDLRNDETRYACVASWLIQKSHESHEWWAETVGTQVTRLEDQIMILRREIDDLKTDLAEMKKPVNT